MKAKIKEVQDYFKNKILKGEFEVYKTTENVITLSVDSDYKFGFLVGNYPTSQYKYADLNFIDLNLTDEEEKTLSGIMNPIMDNYKRNTLLSEKRAELAKLEEELNIQS